MASEIMPASPISSSLISGFNEAEARWPRKCHDADERSWHRPRASMRPRRDGLGNILEWREYRLRPLASMRPRRDGLGNAARRHHVRHEDVASMRPRRDGLGNHSAPEEAGEPRQASMRPRRDGLGNRRLAQALSLL